MLAGDAMKGAAASLLGRQLAGDDGAYCAGTAAVFGHCAPVWSGFRGGKGVATTLGVVLAAMPAVGGLLLLIWLAVAAIWRYSSLAALVASAALPVLAWSLDGRPPMVGLGVALLLIVLVRHRENIIRLRRGTEGKIGHRVETSNGHIVK